LLKTLEVFKKYKVNVNSLTTPSYSVEGKRLAAIRIKTENYKDIVEDLEKAGCSVVSIGKWPSV